MTISACLITLDEARRLPGCLGSIGFCDEVVVVDSGSTDGTVELARAAGARVIEHPWLGFAAQRNLALDAARGDWILELDADEWLSEEAQREVLALLEEDPGNVDMAVIPCREHFLGRTLGPSSHYPFYRPRLFRRGSYRHDEAIAVHEGLAPRSRPAVLRSDMHHLLADTIGEALRDAITYGRLQAGQLDAVSAAALVRGVAARPLIKFLYRCMILGGWHDGWAGLVRMALESFGDAATWLFAARGGVRTWRGRSETRHFGRRRTSTGPIRILALGPLAGGDRAVLERAAAAGAWITVISAGDERPSGPDAEDWRVHRIRRRGPLLVLRAMDAEAQLGDWDLVLASQRSVRWLLRRLPAGLRSYAPVLPPEQLRAERLAAVRANVS